MSPPCCSVNLESYCLGQNITLDFESQVHLCEVMKRALLHKGKWYPAFLGDLCGCLAQPQIQWQKNQEKKKKKPGVLYTNALNRKLEFVPMILLVMRKLRHEQKCCVG